MLDTSAVSYAVRFPQGRTAKQWRRVGSVSVSTLVEAEIRFGVARKPEGLMGRRALAILDAVEVLSFDSSAAQQYAVIREYLSGRGKQLAEMDLLIAGHALSEEATLVTLNVKHFQRVPGLTVENWETAKQQ